MIANGNATGVVLLRRSFDVADLADVRELVHSTGLAAGLSAAQTEGFAAAVGEVMANAILHGGTNRDVTVSMVESVGARAEVFDDGQTPQFDVPARPPPPDQLSGRGLWIAARMCDRIRVRTGWLGTLVVLETDYLL
jgi:anti-sigma regulatory factor (Ser/Thr protein kinase)